MKTKKKALIIGASEISKKGFLKETEFDCIVAADGGYRYCLKEGKEPDFLIGDFDTLDTSLIRNPKSIKKLNPIKDDTDTFYAVKFLLEQGYEEIHFLGCLGGKIEHTLGNIQILSYLKDHNRNGFLYSEDCSTVIFMLENDSITFKKDVKGMVSVFSYTTTCEGVSISNMKYPLDHATMTSSIPLGVSNEFLVGKEALGTISIEKGRLLIVAPTESMF